MMALFIMINSAEKLGKDGEVLFGDPGALGELKQKGGQGLLPGFGNSQAAGQLEDPPGLVPLGFEEDEGRRVAREVPDPHGEVRLGHRHPPGGQAVGLRGPEPSG